MRIKSVAMAGVTWFMGLAALAPQAPGAYLESDVRGPGEEQPALVDRVPPSGLQPQHPLQSLVRAIRVGDVYRYRRLTVFPLYISVPAAQGILTMDEAFTRGRLTVREKGDGEVPRILVRNDVSQPVFLMSGEMILGGRQNRILREDVLIGAESGFVELPVYCGERDRWAGVEPVFPSAGALSGPGIRKMVAEDAGQDRIWGAIERGLAEAGVAAPTKSYQSLYDDRAGAAEITRCVDGLRGVMGREAVGCVVASEGRILGADLFSDPRLFGGLWEKIARSYATEVIVPLLRQRDEAEGLGDRRKGRPTPSQEEVRLFLAGVMSAPFSEVDTAGEGRLWRVDGRTMGHALEWRGEVVHASLFPGATIWPMERK